MTYGYNGKILHVNLTNGKTWIDEHSMSWYRTYMGGRNFALWYLTKEIPGSADPLGPDNVLVLATSVVTGAPVAGTSRWTVAAKSPLTGFFGESQAGGYWGPELKAAGYDAVVVHGKSPKPCYLWINDGNVEICDATHLWGMFTADCTEAIRKEHADERIRIIAIGPAGEKMVRFATVLDQSRHAAGRSGLGAVMGSKNLKAVACRGSKKPELADPEYVRTFAKSFAERVPHNADTSQFREYGTAYVFVNLNTGGALVTRNWSEAQFEGVSKVDHLAIHQKLEISHDACYACPVRCKKAVKASEPYSIDPRFGGPEFETMAAFSSNCGCDDVYAMAKCHELCNAYGMDTISAGATITWLMECFERGLLTPADTGGLSIRWGDSEGMVKLVEMIGKREGFGDLLANGSAYAAQSLGRGTETLTRTVKGQEFPMHEPRAKMGLAYHFALSPTGADHIQAEHDGVFDPDLTAFAHKAEKPSFFMEQSYPLGVLEPVPGLSAGEDKARLFYKLQHHFSFLDVLDWCVFTTAPVRITTFDEITRIMQAVTGWNVSFWEIMKAGERSVTMARVFNIKHGLTPDDDRLPVHMHEPINGGSLEGSFVPEGIFYEGLKLYYEMSGWDRQTGIPTDGKLVELDLDWMRDELKEVR